MPRLFIALRPPPAVRDALIDAMEGLDSARWQDDAALHLTLRFIGEVERPQANDLAETLGAVRAPRFAVTLAGLGTFERRGRVNTLWAGVAPSRELEALRQKVERAAERAGLPRETRRFTPHVTLARLGGGSNGAAIAAWLGRFGSLAAGTWETGELILYESHLGHEGAHYEAIARYPLTA